MKRSAIITIFLMLALTACNKNKPAEAPVAPAPALMPGAVMPPDHPPTTMSALAPSTSSPTSTSTPPGALQYLQTQKATVVSVLDIPEFTYIEVSQDGANRWIAAKTVAVKKGDAIKFDAGSTMDNFKSKSLNRTFPSMTFVNRVTVTDGK
jgi:hypothetical protein